MDYRDLERTADDLERQAYDLRRQAADAEREATDLERLARDNRSEASVLRRDERLALKREMQAESELRAARRP